MILDGQSQPGFAGVPLITLGTPAAGSLDGLTVTSQVTVKDLTIDGYGLRRGWPDGRLDASVESAFARLERQRGPGRLVSN